MSNKYKRVNTLLKFFFSRYLKKQSTEAEREFIDNLYQSLHTSEQPTADINDVRDQIKANIDKSIKSRSNKTILFKRKYSIPAAAAMLVLAGTLSFLLIDSNSSDAIIFSKEQLSERKPLLAIGNEDIYSVRDTIPDGTQFIVKDNEEVLDLSSLIDLEQVRPIHISNPSTTPFSILLPDGSQIWLNQHASIQYDTDFGLKTRQITMKGEVYYDVKKKYIENQSLPFTVYSPLQTIEVLGTQFNVNANEQDEENVELIEGSIQLAHNIHHKKSILHPGEQAFLKKDEKKILVISQRNGHKANAWRKGLFYFENETMHAIGKELSRWYDQKVVIDASIKDLTITGVFSRYNTIEEVMEIVKMTNNIQYERKEGIIYVTPKLN